MRLARPAPLTFPAPRGAAPQKAGKRGAGVARAFTSAQPQLAGPFAEKEEQSRLCSDAARVFFRCGLRAPPHPPRREARHRKRPESAAQAPRARLQARSRSKRGLLRKRRSRGAGRRRLFCDRCNLPKIKKTSEQSGLCSDTARVFFDATCAPRPPTFPAPRGAAAAKGRKARRRRRARVYKHTAAASGAFCGKGGARERCDGGFFAADASAKSKKDVGAKRTLLRRGGGDTRNRTGE